MNYLGHLFFSNDDLDLMICNLYGDFVKGTKYTHYSAKIQEGIKLHRALDFYIDTHPKIKALKFKFFEALPKVSGIAIDLFLDHFIAKNWSDFHTRSYETFLDDFFLHRSNLEIEMKPQFRLFLTQLRKYQWLEHYPSDFGLKKLCEGVSLKLNFENTLHDAPKLFYALESEISTTFYAFMEEAKCHFNVSN